MTNKPLQRKCARLQYFEQGINDIYNGTAAWSAGLDRYGPAFTDRERARIKATIKAVEDAADSLDGLSVELGHATRQMEKEQ